MRHPFLAIGFAICVMAAGAVAVMNGTLSLPWIEASASGGSTVPQPPVKAVKLCRNCGVIKEIDEIVIRGEGKRYDIVVRTEDGLVRIVSTDARPAWRIGDRVRVANGKLSAL